MLGADPAALGSDELRGKIVVIEFATSWCGVPIPMLFCEALDCARRDLEIDPALDGDKPCDFAVRGGALSCPR